MSTTLLIEYADPNDLSDCITLEYRLRPYSIVDRWVAKVKSAQTQYTIDDPERFYGFGSLESQIKSALDQINHCVTVINLHKPIVSKYLTDVTDQDTLNYLHSIFENYHGLLGQQDTEFWATAPEGVRRALADLNIAVHRCESVGRGAAPRHVVTWFGMPKMDMLADADYMLFETTWSPGTVFLNYCEIGKTIDDLAVDHDNYIKPDAFKPFKHYSADFVVRFFEQTPAHSNEKRAIIHNYYLEHQDFFGPLKPCYAIGSLPVADLVTQLDLPALSRRQYVKSVYFN